MNDLGSSQAAEQPEQVRLPSALGRIYISCQIPKQRPSTLGAHRGSFHDWQLWHDFTIITNHKNGTAVIDGDWQRHFKRLMRRMTAGPLDPILLTFAWGPSFKSISGRAVCDLLLGQNPYFFFPAQVNVRYPSRGIRPLLLLKI